MTERGHGTIDLFYKQALISGERVPIIFAFDTFNLDEEMKETIYHGKFMRGKDMLPLTTDILQAESLPLATRYMSCDLAASELCSEKDYENKYDSHCWVPRSDFEPEVEQQTVLSSQAAWHPGFRHHRFESRKYALTILHGFKSALKIWEDGIEESGFPLKESYWHIGDKYKTFQDNLMTYFNGRNKGKSVCEVHFGKVGLDRACRTVMHGMSEYTPINLSDSNSISAHLTSSFNREMPSQHVEESYSGLDLLPTSWKIPNNEVDVHAIAIATTYENPNLSHIGTDEAGIARMMKRSQINFEVDENTDEKRKYTDSSTTDIMTRRNLSSNVEVNLNDEGWKKREEVVGYCDGSSMSYNCIRSKTNPCLLSGHNDAHSLLTGNGLSGWLIVNIPTMIEGLIIARMEVRYYSNHFI